MLLQHCSVGESIIMCLSSVRKSIIVCLSSVRESIIMVPLRCGRNFFLQSVPVKKNKTKHIECPFPQILFPLPYFSSQYRYFSFLKNGHMLSNMPGRGMLFTAGINKQRTLFIFIIYLFISEIGSHYMTLTGLKLT